MSKPRYGWWTYAKYMARNYPNLCRELEDKRATSTTTNYSAGPRGSGDARGTEAAAMRQLSPVKMREYEAVRKAVEAAGAVPGNGYLRVKLVEMVYFKRTHTLEGACQALHISYITGKRYNQDFLCRIARAFGLLD